MTAEEVKHKLQDELDRVAHEIHINGVDSLFRENQWVTGGKITVTIDHNLFARITYESTVVPKRS